MTNPNPKLIAVLILSALPGVLLAGQTDHDKVGQVGSPYLQVSPSVRLSALGGDQVAAEGDSTTLFSNPAGIASLPMPELWLTHNESVIDTKYETLGFGLPAKNNVFAFTAQYINRGSEERVGIDGSGQPVTGLGEFKYTTTLLNVAWARQMAGRWSVGISGKGWQDSLDGQTTSGFAGDIGIQAKNILPSLDLAAAYRNLGPDVDGYQLPRNAAVGLGYRFLKSTTLFAQGKFSNYQSASIHSGLEFKRDNFWLRGGYENQTADVNDSLSKFSFGAGLRIKGWKVDYAWKPMGDLGDQHRISLTLGFGMSPEEREKAAKDLDQAMEKRIAEHLRESMEQGIQALKMGAWEKAAASFEKALTWDAQNMEAMRSLKLAKDKMVFAEAQKLYRAGDNFSNQTRWLEAASSYQQALKLVPSFEEAKKGLQIAKKNIEKTNGRKVEIDPQEQAYNQGIRYFLDGQYDKALNVWERLLVTSPNRPNLREYVEKAEKMKLQQELAAMKAKELRQNDQVELLIQQGYTLYRLGQTDKAIATWEKVMALEPTNTDAKAALKEARAKKDLMKGENVAQVKVEELNSHAMDAYVNGDLNKAVLTLRQALAMDPRNARVRNNLNRVESELASRSITSK